jgi:hypothetical protein
MLRKQDYNTHTFIAANTVSSGLATGTLVKPSNITVGEVVLTDLANKVLAAYPAKGSVRIVQGMGADKPLKTTDILDVTNTEVTWKNFVRGVEQKVAIGFDGSTGSLPAANDTSYYIRLKKLDNDAANRSQPQTAITAQFKSSAAATQQELALGLTAQMFANTKYEAIVAGKPSYVAIKAISNATPNGTSVGTGEVTFGSKLITLALAPVGAIAIGDEIQVIGDSYIVEGIDVGNKTITITSEYRGIDATGVTIDDVYTAPATAYGITITGIRNPFSVNTYRDYYRNRFQVIFSDSSIPEKTLTASFEGNGEAEEVAMNEYMSWGFVGQNQMLDTPSVAREQIVNSTGVYGTLQIKWASENKHMLGVGNFKGSVLVYCELNSNVTPSVIVTANSGRKLLDKFIANTGIAADGLSATSLNEV